MSTNIANILAGIGSTTGIGTLAYFAPSGTALPAAVAYTADVQTVTISGTPTGGTFSLTAFGQTASALAYNITTTALQTALQAAWGGLQVLVAGTAGTTYTLTFPTAKGLVPLVTGVAAFTGGSSPAIAVAHTTPGAGATMATAPIPSGFSDAGWCAATGLVANVTETVNKVKGYGSTNILRVIISDSERAFDLEFLETNAVSQAVYNRQAIGSVVPDLNGAFDIPVGAPLTTVYAALFDVIDGPNHLRIGTPNLQVSGIKARTVAPGKEITYPVTLTALPDTTGVAVYQSYVVAALGTS